jgi:hypothetical protein
MEPPVEWGMPAHAEQYSYRCVQHILTALLSSVLDSTGPRALTAIQRYVLAELPT